MSIVLADYIIPNKANGSIRGNLQSSLYNQTSTVTHTGGATPAETSLLGTGVGSLTIPANFFQVGRAIKLVNRSLLTVTSQPKTSTIKVYLGADKVITDTVAFGADVTGVYAEIDLEIRCTEIGPTGGAFAVLGSMVYGTGVSGGAMGIRFLTGTFTTVDVTQALAFNTTFKWANGTAAGDIIVSKSSVLEAIL